MDLTWTPWKNTGLLRIEFINHEIWSIPTMLGCPIGCKFCISSSNKYDSKLSSDDLISLSNLIETNKQVEWSLTGEGEPSLNIDNCQKAAWELKYHKNINKMRICFSGLKSEKLLNLKWPWPVRHQCSLHSAVDEIRKSLIPNTISVHLLKHRCEQLSDSGPPLFLNVVLQEGVNDDEKNLSALKEFVRNTPWTVVFNPLMRTNEVIINANVERWSAELNDIGVNTEIYNVIAKKIVNQQIYMKLTSIN